MNREKQINAVVFAALVLLGVGTRWLSQSYQSELANFTATAAAGIFAGYFFANRLTAILVPAAIMAVSNVALKPYENGLQMIIVYAALLVPVAAGMLLQKRFRLWKLPLFTIGQAVVFFVVTNFAWWVFYDLYPKTLDGLITGYVQGLPFFGRTMAGDLLFTGILFGTYAAAVNSGALAPATVSKNDDKLPADQQS